MFSNRYIFTYAAVLVTVVAAVLAFTAVSLKPRQEQNMRTEKIQNLLKAVNIESTARNAEELYTKYITEELAVDAYGNIISRSAGGRLDGDTRPFDINLKEQQSLKNKDEKAVFPVYICKKEEKISYIVPLLGTGLWGPVWGNIALAEDFNTVVGIVFDHKSETPGLGAEIASENFQSKFIGKQIFKGQEFVSITVKKVADKTSLNEVDALSGGTITSEAVSKMLRNDLSFYKGFKSKLNTGALEETNSEKTIKNIETEE